MRLAIISFTDQGSRLNAQLCSALALQGYDCTGYGTQKYASAYRLEELREPLRAWTGRMFAEADGILFIGAAGIAVRSIAPYVEDKMRDPAVAVMDEKGVFAISLLSGHLGGANALAGTLANLAGAIPVITTATDVNGKFAVDVFAKKNRLYISSRVYAKEISADVLDEKKIGFCTDYPVLGAIPEELDPWDPKRVFEGTNGICISLSGERVIYKQTLQLIPEIVTIGIGCKKQTSAGQIEESLLSALRQAHISIHAVRGLASIDLKAKEPGILAVAEKYGLPFVTYSAEELRQVRGTVSESAFVQSVTGVDNVCERSAILGSGNGKLILPKQAGKGVTIAAAEETDYRVTFQI